MKTTHFKHLRISLFIVLTMILGIGTMSAASISHNGINYTTSGNKATLAKYTTGSLYTGDIVIPEKFTEGGVEYTVVATAANAFKDCVGVTTVDLPATCVTIGRSTFAGCTGLTNCPYKEAVISLGTNVFDGCSSLTEAFIPANITQKLVSTKELNGCSSLKKLVIKDSGTEIAMDKGIFGDVFPPLEEVYYGRNIGGQYSAPFKGITTLKKVVVGDLVTNFKDYEFMGCSALETVELSATTTIQAIGGSCFKDCSSLKNITLPAVVTVIPSLAFYGCSSLSGLTLNNSITTINQGAFNGCPINVTTLPSELTTIGSLAFANGSIATTLTLPAKLTTIGEKAFFGSSIDNVVIPASVTSIGVAAFAEYAGLTSFTVDAANANYKAVNDVLLSIDGKTILRAAPNSKTLKGMETFQEDNAQNIDDYAFAGALNKKFVLPSVKVIGYRSFYNTTNLTEFTVLAGTSLQSNFLEGSALKTLTINEGLTLLPKESCLNCVNLTTITLPVTLNVIMMDALKGCTALKKIELGKYLNYMEAGAIPSTIEEIVCKNVNVPIINENLFSADMSKVTCKVAQTAVADYKAATGWNYLNIVGDESIVGNKEALGCPTGIYFATKDGELKYLNESNQIIDTNISSGLHAFQLGSAHNRIYVGYAGKKFTYSGTPANEGEGEVFYLNKSGESFYRVTLVSNIGYNAFEDPFSLSVDAPNHKLLVADRNVGVHLIDTERPGLYGQQPFLLQNNWLSYYNQKYTYGAIGCGIFRDSNGLYWMGKKFNGNGIFRFKDSDIHVDAAGVPQDMPYKVLLDGTQMTTFYLDEDNGFIYIYLQTPLFTEASAGVVPGIYRFNLSDVITLDDALTVQKNGTLVDSAPVLKEGSDPNELTGITQISGNGTNIYWAYIAPATNETAHIGIDLDPTNPLHKSGIKYISAKGGTPEVKYAVENVEAYGVVAAIYDPTGSVEGNISNKVNKCTVKGSTVEISSDAIVNVYGTNGILLNKVQISGNGTVSVSNYASGLYIVQIAYTDGTKEVVKVGK